MNTRLAAAGVMLVMLSGGPVGVGSLAPALAAPAPEALTAARFSLTIDGYEIAVFSELDRITSQASLPEGKEILKKLEPASRHGAVILRRALNRGMELWAWHEAVLLGDVAAARKHATLTAYAADGRPVARYHLESAWPSKLEIGALKAGASEVLMETVTLVCDHILRVSI